MSSPSIETAAEAEAEAEAEAKRTANGASDLLDDGGSDAAPAEEANPPPPNPFSPPPTPSESVAASVVSEAASMTGPASPPPHSPSDESQSKDEQTADFDDTTSDNIMQEVQVQDDDEISKVSSSGSAVAKPSIATVTAIVNAVLREKENNKASGGSAGEAVDIASIASKEVDKFYEGEYDGIDDARFDNNNNGRDEVYAEYNRHLPAQARARAREKMDTRNYSGEDAAVAAAKEQARAHPWNRADGGEKKSLFSRGRDGKNKASAMISSKIKMAIGSAGNNRSPDGTEKGENNNNNHNMSSPPAGMFHRKTAGKIFDEEIFDEDSPDFNDLCEELGITDQTHPHLRRPYRRDSSILMPSYSTFQQVFRSTKCHCCLIVACLIGIAVGITAAVTKGIEHSAKRDHELNPHWITEETAKQEANENKDWWAQENADAETATKPKHEKIIFEDEMMENRQDLSPEELEELYYQVSDAYLPIWFDRSTGWEGTTYKEGLEFCRGHDNFVPCPYEVYCPGFGGKLIFNEFMDEVSKSWAPILDVWDDWVQVGQGSEQCITYLGYRKKRPDWGWNNEGGGNRTEVEKITRHIMCCLEEPLVDEFDRVEVPLETTPHQLHRPPDVHKEGGEGVDDPIPPPPQTDDADTVVMVKTGSTFELSKSTVLTKLDEIVRETLRPFWFDSNDGWAGTTYTDAKAFCENIPNGANGETFHLCPHKAFCPNGRKAAKPLVFQMNPFDGGLQWAPMSNSYNSWVMVGKVNDEEEPATCDTFIQIYHREPDWGVDGSEPGLKKHILCCEEESGHDGGVLKGDIEVPEQEQELLNEPAASQNPAPGMYHQVPIVQIKPTNVPADEQQASPQNNTAKEEDGYQTDYDDHVMAMVMALNPLWYNRDDGWNGGSHDGAIEFCFDKDQELCPAAAYCPRGPMFPALEGAFSTLSELNSQWAPAINRPNQWLLISPIDHDSDMQCKDYELVHNGEEPEWGYDSSMAELKHYIMCCEKTSSISKGAPQQYEDEDTTTPQIVIANEEDGHHTNAGNSSPHAAGEHNYDDHVMAMAEALNPLWYNRDDGWNGGSHDGAIEFCFDKGQELCPSAAYCPNGPSFPALEGAFSTLGELNSQWAPSINRPNEWLLISPIDHDSSHQCKDYEQVNDDKEPEWGYDSSMAELKHYIMCCEKTSSISKGAPQQHQEQDVTITPQVVIANEEDGHHTNAGNSSPHAAGEHNYDDHVMAMVKTLNPLWYNRDDGWNGGSHDDALEFCFDKDQELCPMAAYCPNGPSFPALEGAFSTLGELNSQWAPSINRPNEWLLISPIDHDSSHQCKDYEQVNDGEQPEWGYDSSMAKLKHYIMCCKKTSSISKGAAQQHHEQDVTTTPQISEEPSSAEAFATSSSNVSESIEEEESVEEETFAPNPAPFVGFWFNTQSGWNSGSHDDAMHFCAIKEVNGNNMVLCPYNEYCPFGPSDKPVQGHGLKIGSGNNEQWAPTSNGDNQWVMIGMHGHNTATQCLTHGQLNGMAPDWGLDSTNKGKKQHVMCCLPLAEETGAFVASAHDDKEKGAFIASAHDNM